jgi:hypothetical protein
MTTPHDEDNTSSGPSRRNFLKFAALLAGSVGLQALPGINDKASAVITDSRAYASSRFAFELDGILLDFVKSVEGGFARADVVQERLGQSHLPKKHLANLKYSDIVMQCDPLMPEPLQKWIAASLAMTSVRKNGAIITADLDMKERSRLEFFNALLSELTIPACDASSREAGVLTVKLAPEYTRPVAGKGSQLPAYLGGAKQQKTWLPSNFRLQIQGLEAACTRINKIDALTIKTKVAENPIGELRDYEKEPTSLELPNLVMTLPEADAAPFYQWFDDFVVKGNMGDDKERAGFLELLSPDFKTVLLRVNFSHLGIFSFSPIKREANADGIARVKVEMYCEQITLGGTVTTQAAPPPPPQEQPAIPQGRPLPPGGLTKPPIPLR